MYWLLPIVDPGSPPGATVTVADVQLAVRGRRAEHRRERGGHVELGPMRRQREDDVTDGNTAGSLGERAAPWSLVIVSVSSRAEAVKTGKRGSAEKAKSIAAVTFAEVSSVIP